MRFFILFMLCFLASEQDITADAAISKSILYEAMPGLTDVTGAAPCYSNGRFGFSLSWLSGNYSVREADNGDGIVVQDNEGFTLLAYGAGLGRTLPRAGGDLQADQRRKWLVCGLRFCGWGYCLYQVLFWRGCRLYCSHELPEAQGKSLLPPSGKSGAEL